MGSPLAGKRADSEPGGWLGVRWGRSKRPGIRASPPFPYRTASIGRGENARLRRTGASRTAVSAWDARRGSAKVPRNRGNFRAGPRCARGFSGVADWLAERAVQRELVSPPPFPDLGENPGNSRGYGLRRPGHLA
jgi:hypothetical protein